MCTRPWGQTRALRPQAPSFTLSPYCNLYHTPTPLCVARDTFGGTRGKSVRQGGGTIPSGPLARSTHPLPDPGMLHTSAHFAPVHWRGV